MKKTIRENLINDLNTAEWKKTLFSDKYLKYEDLYESEEKVRQALILPYGGFDNSDDIDVYFKKLMVSSIDEIIEWLFNSKKRVIRFELEFESNIGYVISKQDGEKTGSNKLVLALRRNKDCITKYGFFLSAFNVI